MGRVQTERCVIQMSKGNDGRKYEINDCVCVFLSVNTDCTFRVTSDEKIYT